MSVQAISWALAQRVLPVQKLVLISIANCADKDGENAFPGQQHIAEEACISVRSVQRHTVWLEKHGFLSRHRRERINGSRTSDGYTLHMGDKATDWRVVQNGARRQPGSSQGDTGGGTITVRGTEGAISKRN